MSPSGGEAFSRPPTGFSELPDALAGHDREVESLTNAPSDPTMTRFMTRG